MAHPVVSIITIVYNGEKHIADTIRSVAAQTYRHLEYIIVDGGSTDNTLNIVRHFGNVITAVITEKDTGISDAFNKGLRVARGDIIGFINADDWYEPDAVENVVAQIEGYDIAYGDLQFWKEGRKHFVAKGDHRFLTREMTINHPTVFIRRECYHRLGEFDEQYQCAMDYDLLLRFSIGGCRFIPVPAVLAHMRSDGLSDANWMLACRETRRIKDKYLPGRKVGHRLYSYKQMLAIAISKMLYGTSLYFILRLYRSRLAKVRKLYHESPGR